MTLSLAKDVSLCLFLGGSGYQDLERALGWVEYGTQALRRYIERDWDAPIGRACKQLS